MSVRTKLIAFGVLLAALPLVTGLILLVTSRQIQVAQLKAKFAEEFEKEVFDLTLLTNEFTQFRSPRARRQLREHQEQIQQRTRQLESVPRKTTASVWGAGDIAAAAALPAR